MKKVTSLFQKIGGSIAIFVFALMAVYALGMATPSACCKYYESQKLFYREIMPYNNAILILAIVGLLLASLYYVLRNNVRVVYYVSNFVWDGVFVGYSVLSSIITFVGVSFYQGTSFCRDECILGREKYHDDQSQYFCLPSWLSSRSCDSSCHGSDYSCPRRQDQRQNLL